MAKTKGQLRAEEARLRAQLAQQAKKTPQVPQAQATTPRQSTFTPTILQPTTENIATGSIKQFPRFTPQQQGLQQQFLNQLAPLLQQLAKPIDVNPIIQQRTRDFRTQSIPSLMERLGGGTAQYQRSGAIPASLASAESLLQQDLASLQTQAQMSDLGRLQKLFGGLSSLGFEPQYERSFFPSKPGFGEIFSNNLASGLGGGLGSFVSALPRLLAGLFF